MQEIIMTANDYGEVEVPEKNGEVYYAGDVADAIDTAHAIYGEQVKLVLVWPVEEEC